MSCASCGQAVKRTLEGVPGKPVLSAHSVVHDCVATYPGIKNVYVNLDDEVVIVETCLSSSNIQRRLEDAGRLVVFRGHGGIGTDYSVVNQTSAG